MATLNTAIRGAQISLSAEVIAVATDELAFIDADGIMKRESVADIATAMAGDGLKASAGVFAIEPADFAGAGLEDDGSDNLKISADSISDSELNAGAGSVGDRLSLASGGAIEWVTPTDTDEKVKAQSGDTAGYLEDVIVDLDGAVVDVSADSLMFLDGDSKAKLETIADLATAMAGTGITATNGVLAADAVADNIVEGDIVVENMSADIDATGFAGAFTLANTPLTASVQIYLNGLLQEEGTGKDYTLSGTTVTFATAPVSGDIVIAHYIKNN